MKIVAVISVTVIGLSLLLSGPAFGQTGVFEVLEPGLAPDDDWNWGVALGDVDGDKKPDIIFASDGQNRLYANDGSGVFTDVSTVNFPGNNHLSWGVAVGDVDGDNDLDVVFANTNQNELYPNDGSGLFRDVTLSNLPEDSDDSRSVGLGDVDGDGDLDVVFASRLSRNRLYINDGYGVFRDAPSAQFPGDGGNTRGVIVGDVDGDSDLDVVFANKDGQDRLYVNDGSGVFTDVTLSQFPKENDNSRGIALGDVDGDSDIDIVFATRRGRNRLYLNDGSGVFEDATAILLPTSGDWSLDVALGDVDGDRDLDILVANFNEQNELYLNDGSGVFEVVTSAHLPVDSDGSLGIVLEDVDGDGDLDIVVANSSDNRLYTNKGKPSVPFGLVGCEALP